MRNGTSTKIKTNDETLSFMLDRRPGRRKRRKDPVTENSGSLTYRHIMLKMISREKLKMLAIPSAKHNTMHRIPVLFPTISSKNPLGISRGSLGQERLMLFPSIPYKMSQVNIQNTPSKHPLSHQGLQRTLKPSRTSTQTRHIRQHPALRERAKIGGY